LEDKIAEHFALLWRLSVQLLPMLSSHSLIGDRYGLAVMWNF